ncbi:cysteine--tRNA ligase [Mycoplasmopsis pullorum]|nr:cysteine--tRNA ligase [Mycoplasmopsis pullorum]TNK82106.1 cysteine--tRNA ligase [Mycoplasmopsis pullorum]TNK83210.1 cysteine--tRNA ligase [Mycoplasmopsis pullorum]TNK84519.1 cysteine--tRNA ligase [Mycoplasmopsis pullorum]TNK85434.1 cysteine--tRNA ligase [Mycoplasmopsis pullorum]TNK85762.1 cysteine--tRNA ligase [Mycoplasmopsis pullorum]
MLKIYVCGPTVYDHIHIGNMRPILLFDLILRAVRYKKIDYFFLHNITDIDDKIINKAISENKSEKEVSDFFTNAYLDLLKQANIDTITKIEKVTDNLDLIENYLDSLSQNGSTYTQDDDLLFSVEKYQNYYGTVSHQKLDEMFFEENSANKNFPADFALWKNTKVGVKYNSKFGAGRPGWHTECSALIYKYFKDEGVHIHGGGIDLIFPHHENENIQHFALTNKPIAQEWLRCGQINLYGEKMSKSKGNIIKAKVFFDEHKVDVYRTILLNSTISGPINLNEDLIKSANAFNLKIRRIGFYSCLNSKADDTPNYEIVTNIINLVYERDFSKFMFEVNKLIKEFNKTKSIKIALSLIEVFKILGYRDTFENFEVLKPIFEEWSQLVDTKEYEKADALRVKLQKEKIL